MHYGTQLKRTFKITELYNPQQFPRRNGKNSLKAETYPWYVFTQQVYKQHVAIYQEQFSLSSEFTISGLKTSEERGKM